MKLLNSIENEQVQMDIVECDCGYHMGLDASYLIQVGDFKADCPSCDSVIDTSVLFEKEARPVGYQVDDGRGEIPAEMRSFEIYTLPICLSKVKEDPKIWRLIPIYEGDVEKPTFIKD